MKQELLTSRQLAGNSELASDWAPTESANHGTIGSDEFEEFFVLPLPDRSAGQTYNVGSSSKIEERDFGYGGQRVAARPQSAPGFRSKAPRIIPERSSSKGVVLETRKLDFATTNLPRPFSIIQEEDVSKSSTPAALPSNNATSYFGSKSSKRSSSTPPKNAQSYESKLAALEVLTPSSDFPSPSPGVVTDGIIRPATATSIESYSPDQVKSVEIPRRSFEDPTIEPQTPRESIIDGQAGSSMKLNDGVEFPSPPPSLPKRRSSVRSSVSSVRSSQASQHLNNSAQDAGPLNNVMSKQRAVQPRSRGYIGESKAMTTPGPASTPLNPGEDNFDRQVSEVLNRVHAPIKFKARMGAVNPVAKSTVESRLRTKAERQGKNMTLAPAEPSPRKASPADPEVKLYHLSQVGRAEPIKLYVRLVGESSERVMVRVGGGWADLADYLRQYAEHHGSRTVSEGAVELQTAEAITTPNTGGSGKRTFSGPAFAQEPKSRSPITPSVSKTFNDIPMPAVQSAVKQPTTAGASVAGVAATRNIFDWDTSTRKPRLWLGDYSDDEDDETGSPDASTPRSAKASSRPSTATAAFRPNSRSGALEAGSPISPGLDGKMRSELPEQKAKWVEGMIEKAMKSASVAGGSGAERSFGDLGSVGGTKRVVFRSTSGAEGSR